jgi:hypothetical protein
MNFPEAVMGKVELLALNCQGNEKGRLKDKKTLISDSSVWEGVPPIPESTDYAYFIPNEIREGFEEIEKIPQE